MQVVFRTKSRAVIGKLSETTQLNLPTPNKEGMHIPQKILIDNVGLDGEDIVISLPAHYVILNFD